MVLNFQEQPSYANDPGIVEVTSSGVQSHKPVSTVHQASSLRRGATSVHNFGEEEPRIRNQTRAQVIIRLSTELLKEIEVLLKVYFSKYLLSDSTTILFKCPHFNIRYFSKKSWEK